MKMKCVVGILAIALAVSCAGGRKLTQVKEGGMTVQVAVGSLDDVKVSVEAADTGHVVDVVEVEDLQGNRIIMNAVKDEETGEMVAQEHLDEIVVQARFSHVAERNGMVDLVFELAVPEELQQRSWQLRLVPHYRYMDDTLRGDEIHITGEKFRRVQKWEYMMYDNYLSRVVPEHMADTLYAMKRLQAKFVERYGEDERAVSHYRRRLMEKMNSKKAFAKGQIYDRFVVDPFPQGGVKLDSVVNSGTGVVRYFYVQPIAVQPGLKKVEMVMEGTLHTNGRKLCTLAAAEPITFYISSISTLADLTERYLKKVVYRDMHFDASYNIAFAKGEWRVDPRLENNDVALENMKRNLVEIIENEEYEMDSILVAAACSPEGRWQFNEKLSQKRGNEIKRYLLECMTHFRDSVGNGIWEIGIDGEGGEDREKLSGRMMDAGIVRVTEVSEDWEGLYGLMTADTLLRGHALAERCRKVSDPDERESLLLRESGCGGYIRSEIYPKLRRVKLDLKLHRKGMIKDTVHTTELDTVYMRGVEALKERDYRTAVTLLRPYGCYNSAVAYICMGYDNSALEILERLPRSAKRDYMLAVAYARLGKEELAVGYLMNSVEQDESMRHRGNLDPEISLLIKKYGIFNKN